MKIENAIRKLQRNGFDVTRQNIGWVASKPEGKDVIEFLPNGENITCIQVHGKNDHDDIMTDYFAGVFVRNLTQAIKLAD